MIIQYAILGCIPELASNCTDMTNASGTYIGIFIGAVIGGLISWLIYKLNERHDKMLETLEHFEKHNEKTLNSILNLEKKITELVENKS